MNPSAVSTRLRPANSGRNCCGSGRRREIQFCLLPTASASPIVNSPVEVAVNGKAAEVLSAVGFPGAVDGYEVKFRVPPDIANGPASIQLSAAWIAGAPVIIPVQ